MAAYNHEYDFVMDWNQRNVLLPIEERTWDLLRRLVERQKLIAQRAGESKDYVAKHRIVLCLDDAISENMDYAFLGELLSRARHLFIKVIISTQAAQASLRPLGRYNIGILLLGNIGAESVKYSYPMAGASGTHGIRSKKDFVAYYERTIRPYSFIRWSAADPRVPPRLIESTRITAADTVI